MPTIHVPDSVMAAVSFWDHPTETHVSRFIGNGVFIADHWVLTAAHVAAAGSYMRFRVDHETQTYLQRQAPILAPAPFDVVLVRVDTVPTNRTCLKLAEAGTLELGSTLLYTGYHPDNQGRNGVAGPGIDVAVRTTDVTVPPDGLTGVTPEIPAGYSGSAVRRGEYAVALAVGRDCNEPIGYVVNLSAIRSWIERKEHAPDAYRYRAQDVEDRFVECFKDEAFVTAGLRSPSESLPRKLRDALAVKEGPARRGDECMKAVMQLADEFTQALPSVVNYKTRSPGLSQRLQEAMEHAARMLVNPDARSNCISDDGRVIEVSALFDLTGLLALMKARASRGWGLEVGRRGNRVAVPRNVILLPEREGLYTREETLNLIEDLLAPSFNFDKTQDFGRRQEEVAAQLDSDNILGGQRYAKLPLGYPTTYKPSMAGEPDSPDVLEWMRKTMKVPPIRMTEGGPDRGSAAPNRHAPGLFLIDERMVYTRITRFLEILARDVWNHK